MDSDDRYFVRRQARVDGPWTMDKLRSEVLLKKLGRHHELSSNGEQWFPAGDVAELFRSSRVAHAGADEADQGVELLVADDEPPLRASLTKAKADRGNWYYFLNEQRSGPVPLLDLIELAVTGRMPADTLVWRDGMPDWLPASQITELSSIVQSETRRARSNDNERQRDPAEDVPKTEGWASGAAVAGAILFLLSPIPFLGILGPIPIAMGFVSLRRIRRSDGRRTGATFARLGIGFGVVAMTISLVTSLFFISRWM